MKNRYILLALFFLGQVSSSAQYSEVGLAMGMSNYLGDLTPPRQFFLETHFALSGSYQFNLHPHVAFRTQLTWGQISGNDQHSAESSGRRERNLSFKSNLVELALLGQINILPFHPSRNHKPVSPYGILGLSIFYFNPKAFYKSDWVALQPLGTEGQGMVNYPDRKKYKQVQIAIPFGGGLKMALSRHLNISVELGLRKTFTDYLDDVSKDYVPLAELRAENGDLAAALSNRTLDEDGKQIDRTGIPRGHRGKDWFTFAQVAFSYSLQKNYYFRKNSKRKKKKHKRKKSGKQQSTGRGKWF